MLPQKLFNVISIFLLFSFSLSACTSQGPETQNSGAIGTPGEEIASEEQKEETVQVPTDDSTSETPPDLTGEIITVYHIGDLTGPTASYETPGIRGVEDMVATINASGGIFGAQLNLMFYDSKGEPEQAVMDFENILLKDNNPLAVILHSAQENLTISQRANDEHAPVIGGFVSQGERAEDIENYVFGLNVPYPQQFAQFLSFLVNNWEEIRPEGAGDEIKIAYISWDNEFGQAALTEDSRAYADRLGLEIVFEATFISSSTSDLTNQILDARKAEANVIYTNTHGYGPAILLNDLHRMGLDREFIVAGPAAAMDASTYAYLEKPEFFDGFYAPFYSAWWSDETNASISIAKNNLQKHQRSIAVEKLNYLIMHGGVDILRYAIEQAILQVGFEELIGEDIYNVLSKMENYEVLTDLMTVDFSDGRRSLPWLQIRQVKGIMDFVPVQDFGDVIDLP